MSRKWLIALALTCACSKSQPAGETPAATVVESAPADASPPAPVPPAPPHPVVRVEKGAPVTVADETFELRSYKTESTDAGDGAVIEMTIAGEHVTFSDPPPGAEPKLVAWAGGLRAEVVDHAPGFVALHVDRITDEVVPDSEQTVRVARKQSVDIGGGLSLRFLSHGHKMVAVGGPRSPLMVAVEYRRGDELIERGNPYLYPPDEARWTWRQYTFHMTEHEYNSFMVLKLTRRALAPVDAQ